MEGIPLEEDFVPKVYKLAGKNVFFSLLPGPDKEAIVFCKEDGRDLAEFSKKEPKNVQTLEYFQDRYNLELVSTDF